MTNRATVRAAGGVVWRPGPDDDVEVLLVHRPRYDDWSLPKGKLDPGESDEAAALREVAEETGLRCRLGQELIGTSYVDGKGRPKTVRYWAMQAEGGEFLATDEVDELEWLAIDEAITRMTYRRDDVVLEDFARRVRTAS